MTGLIPGAPVAPISGRGARFMFLGGPLDHTIRELPTTGGFEVPPEHYTTVTQHREKFQDRPVGRVIQTRMDYHRYRVTGAGDRSWFVMILDGHNPTPSTLLDSYPFPPIV